MSYQPNCTPPDEEPFTCWCGVTGDFDSMCSDDLDPTCGGLGELNCYCGGDQCVCHWHGSAPCDGCEDCDRSDEMVAMDDWHTDYDDPDGEEAA